MDSIVAVLGEIVGAIKQPFEIVVGRSGSLFERSELVALTVGSEHVALSAIALDRIPNCERDFPFCSTDGDEKHPKLFVQIIPRISDLTDSGDVGVEGFLCLFKSVTTLRCSVPADWRACLLLGHDRRTLHAPLGWNARKRERVRCSSLIDWPVYPRLRHIMQGSERSCDRPMRRGRSYIPGTNADEGLMFKGRARRTDRLNALGG